MNDQASTPIVFVLFVLVLVIAIQAMCALALAKLGSEKKNALIGFIMLGLIALIIAAVIQGLYVLDSTHSPLPSSASNKNAPGIWHQYIQLVLSFFGGLGGGALALLKFGHDVRKLNVETGMARTKLDTETAVSVSRLNIDIQLALREFQNDAELAQQRIQADTSIASKRMHTDTRIAFLGNLIRDDTYRVNIHDFLLAVKKADAKQLRLNLEGDAFFFLFVLKPELKPRFITAINREELDVNELEMLTENLFSA